MRALKTLVILLAACLMLFSSSAWTAAGSLPEFSTTRIRFAQGATSAVASGNLPAHSSARYVLRAGFGQLMEATLSAPASAAMKVTASSGLLLTPVTGTNGPAGFRGYLPYTGDYFLTVSSGSQAVAYSIDVVIPVRIRFERNATSATVTEHLDAYQGLDYILRAGKGQILEIEAVSENANPDDNPLQLVIYGVDGTVLRSGMGEGSSFRGVLPASQDYLVSLRASDVPTNFTMSVIIPQRISFQTGATSASVHNPSLPAGRTQYYSLRAMQGQTMQVQVTPDANLQLIIYGMDGTVLKSGMGGGASFNGLLPSTQDYILAVRAGSDPVSYTLRVAIY
jgi:hypothetical protein